MGLYNPSTIKITEDSTGNFTISGLSRTEVKFLERLCFSNSGNIIQKPDDLDDNLRENNLDANSAHRFFNEFSNCILDDKDMIDLIWKKRE